jgi:hypothetical protein
MLLVRAVGEIEAEDVDAFVDECKQFFVRITGRAYCSYDLSPMEQHNGKVV